MRPRAGSTALDVVGNDGQVWFFVDRLMYELIDKHQRLAVRTMDLRITQALAQRIGKPEVTGWTVAEMELTTDVLRQGDILPAATSTKWSGMAVPGTPHLITVMSISRSSWLLRRLAAPPGDWPAPAPLPAQPWQY